MTGTVSGSVLREHCWGPLLRRSPRQGNDLLVHYSPISTVCPEKI